jgi:hypothetical protein
MRRLAPLAALALVVGCAKSPASPTEHASSASSAPSSGGIAKATSCAGGHMTYLGFRGAGMPSRALLDEILERFPEAAVYEVAEGKLGVLVTEPHSMDVRARHEAAAAAVGWKGDVVDFATVTKACEATFRTPVPLPPPPT